LECKPVPTSRFPNRVHIIPITSQDKCVAIEVPGTLPVCLTADEAMELAEKIRKIAFDDPNVRAQRGKTLPIPCPECKGYPYRLFTNEDGKEHFGCSFCNASGEVRRIVEAEADWCPITDAELRNEEE
jgi:hypothetical protein